MPAAEDRIATLEARIVELEARATPPKRARRGWGRRLAVIGLALVLMIPAGVVLAGGPSFTDVPTTNKFYNDIEAIAATGITSGCTSTRYCPNGLVTRGQMAAFLNRLGALGPGKTPKVNADRVDGRHANQLVRATSVSTTATTTLSTTAATYLSGQITAPTAGYLLVTATVTFENSTAPCEGGYVCIGEAQLQVGGELSTVMTEVVQDGVGRKANVTLTHVFPVASGARTVDVLVREPYTDSDWDVWTDAAEMSILFVPFNGTGG